MSKIPSGDELPSALLAGQCSFQLHASAREAKKKVRRELG